MIIFACKSLLLILLCLLLTACDNIQTASISKICANEPGICNDFHQIADCRFMRTSVIRARYQYSLAADEKNTLLLLEELDIYKSCLELTLQISYARYKDRKKKRFDNYLASKSLIDTLLKTARGTQDPNLAYYLWTHNADLRAKKVFLSAEKRPNLTDVSLLSKLAVYHSADDPQLSLNFYYEALHNSKDIETLPKGIFTQLISILYRHHFYQEAYLWAKVATESKLNSAPIDIEKIIKKGYLSEKLQKKITALSEDYLAALEDGEFTHQAPHLAD